MDRILVIDDESGIRLAVREVLQQQSLQVLVASDEESGIRIFLEEMPLVVLLDIRLGEDSGLETFRRLRQLDPRAIVIFITGHGSSDMAIETMKMGAFDYLVKPLDFDQLNTVVDQALKIGRLMRAPAAVGDNQNCNESSDRIVGNSASMQSICKYIGRIAPQDVNVMILGESGTGKELVARALYQHSKRNQAPFLAINCAAIPENLLESELFGHEQGAFTGADRKRIGKFEQCNMGTIFLDEIGDMPLATQAKILRLLQDGQFQRIGGNETLQTDVRIIAATHQKLDEMIEQNRFRKDLYYRLRGASIHLPSLRERIEDIPELAHYFLFRLNSQLGTHVQSISLDAIDILQSYPWPGNIRELQSVIRESLIVSTGPTLLKDFLPIGLTNDGWNSQPVAIAPLVGQETMDWQSLGNAIDRWMADGVPNIYRAAVEYLDRLIIDRAIQWTENHQGRAADILGISRPTLRSKLRHMAEQEKAKLNSTLGSP